WWPGVSSRLMTQSRYSICMTELATEMPRCFSISIQSEVAWRAALRALTLPAIWIAPAKRSSFSVSVVLPASGCEMIAKVRRRATSWATDIGGLGPARFVPVGQKGLFLQDFVQKCDLDGPLGQRFGSIPHPSALIPSNGPVP